MALPATARILDLGTGSGCIALTLAAELPRAEVWSLDRSLGALALAAHNRRRLDLGRRVHFLASDWGTALHCGFVDSLDLIVSNPPYIDPEQPSEYAADVAAHEPHLALFAAETGLACYRVLFDWKGRYAPRTPLVTEIGRGQLPDLVALAGRFGLRLVGTDRDYGGIERVARWR